MDNAKKDIETRISRSLDAELGDEEQLRLDRELIRNPDARRRMEDYARIDQMAEVALSQALRTDKLPLDPESLPPRIARSRRRRSPSAWWLAGGSAAAALLALAVARFPGISHDASQTRSALSRTADSGGLSSSAIPQPPWREGSMRNAAYVPGDLHIRRDTGRDVLGIIGENGNIYWIEVDRTRTVKRPADPLQASKATQTL